MSRTRTIITWVAALVGVAAAYIMSGTAVTPSAWSLLFLIALAPPVVFLLAWRGTPPPTVAELRYAVRQQDTH
ncbi:MAG TPA: hypothetical protein VMZ90_12595 [Vicinamibacterales bacterium]|nr:hypothetical protein [Vicinamibacterales bacterium]